VFCLYKEIAKLREQNVLICVRKKYALNLTWGFDLLNFAQEIEKTYLRSNVLEDFCPVKGERRSWRFSQLSPMKDLWSHLVVLLIRQSKSKTLLSWNPHPWFYLSKAEHEIQLMELLRKTKSKMFKIVGGDTFLDRWTSKFWTSPYVKYSFAEGPFESKQGIYAPNDLKFGVS